MPANVCVIGAGCSGFTTAKAFADREIDFDCFEVSDQIDGNWAFQNSNGIQHLSSVPGQFRDFG